MNASASNDGQKEAIHALLADWAAGFAGTEPETILTCYAEDAVLQGTLSSEFRKTPEGIREYFEPFYELARRRVEFHQQHVRIYGNTAVCSGTYTFSWEKGGSREKVNARFSFACVKISGQWQIVDHHSSVLPA
jgi:uncharacterized protein (TIGR02246 family)